MADHSTHHSARVATGHPHGTDPSDGTRRGRSCPTYACGRSETSCWPVDRSRGAIYSLGTKIHAPWFSSYDLGFQSPDSEAAKPMVFATTLLLIVLVVLLNLTAILIRERLRRKLPRVRSDHDQRTLLRSNGPRFHFPSAYLLGCGSAPQARLHQDRELLLLVWNEAGAFRYIDGHSGAAGHGIYRPFRLWQVHTAA